MFAGLFVVSGGIFAAIVLVSEGFHLALLKAANAEDDEALPALVRLDEWAGLAGLPAAAAMFLGAAAAIVTTQAFPTWFGLVSGAVALVLVVSAVRIFGESGAGALDSAGTVGPLMIDAWVLAASALLLLRPGDGPNDAS